jgi:hypothetical protein
VAKQLTLWNGKGPKKQPSPRELVRKATAREKAKAKQAAAATEKPKRRSKPVTPKSKGWDKASDSARMEWFRDQLYRLAQRAEKLPRGITRWGVYDTRGQDEFQTSAAHLLTLVRRPLEAAYVREALKEYGTVPTVRYPKLGDVFFRWSSALAEAFGRVAARYPGDVGQYRQLGSQHEWWRVDAIDDNGNGGAVQRLMPYLNTVGSGPRIRWFERPDHDALRGHPRHVKWEWTVPAAAFAQPAEIKPILNMQGVFYPLWDGRPVQLLEE